MSGLWGVAQAAWYLATAWVVIVVAAVATAGVRRRRDRARREALARSYPTPRCTCQGTVCRESPDAAPRFFECPGCLRSVPWCFGAADGYPDLCDNCWCERDAAREREADHSVIR